MAENGGGESAHSKKTKAEVLTRRWVILDSAGNTQVLEAGKNAIMRRTSLPARDLRILDPLLGYPASLLSRERAVVVNMEHIKAIIMAHEVLLLNSKDPSVVPFVEELRLKILRHHQSVLNQRSAAVQGDNADFRVEGNATEGCKDGPFEFAALEACLDSACGCLDKEARILEREAYPALNKLTSRICSSNIEHVQQIKARLIPLTKRVQKVRDELENQLNNDEHMAGMYLTDKYLEWQNEICSVYSVDEEAEKDEEEVNESNMCDAGLLEENDQLESLFRASKEAGKRSNEHQSSALQISRNKQEVAALEMILEASFIQMDGTLNKLSALKENIEDAEDYVSIMQGDMRNRLLKMVVSLMTADMALNVFQVVGALYSMNITIHLFNEQPSVGEPKFLWTIGGSAAGAILIYAAVISWCRYKNLL